MNTFLTWIILASTFQAVQMLGRWTYSGENGPNQWPQQFQQCSGVRQSPVHIHSGNLQINQNLGEFFFGGHEKIGRLKAIMQNSGKAVQVLLSGSQFIEDGGLKGKYIAIQFHFHWGSDSSRGSEHVMNMRRYPMELHIVHFAEKYGNLSTAIGKPDGLAVLALMFEAVEEDNAHFNSLAAKLGRIQEPDTTVEVDEFCLKTIFPGDMKHFYRYRGSLTTPPCQESVIWTIFKDTIQISKRQLDAFRKLRRSPKTLAATVGVHTSQGRDIIDEIFLADNYRPLQELNGRVVSSSFNPELLAAAQGSSATSISGLSLMVIVSAIFVLAT